MARFAGLLLAGLAACSPPPATPLPAAITPSPSPAAESEVFRPRIAYSADAYPFWRDVVSPSARAGGALFDPAESDAAILLGIHPDLTPAPIAIVVTLRLDTAVPPLDSPAVAALVRASLTGRVFAEAWAAFSAEPLQGEEAESTIDAAALRAAFANAGFPDGVPLTLAAFLPAQDQLTAALAARGIDVRFADPPSGLADARLIHGEIVGGFTGTDWADEDGIMLVSIPVSYRVREGLVVRFAPSGMPIVEARAGG